MDRLNVHRSAARQLRESGPRWCEAEFLPAYAADLNPVEAIWNCTKHVDLANYAPDDLFELGVAAGESLVPQHANPTSAPPHEGGFVTRRSPSVGASFGLPYR